MLSAVLLTTTFNGAMPGCPPTAVPWPTDGLLSLTCEPMADATKAATQYLKANMFPRDLPNSATYFDGGIAMTGSQLALSARQKFGWAAKVPKALWQDAVLVRVVAARRP